MSKFLTTVCNRENVTVEQSIIDGIAAASSGDMRCAINTLQFKILQEKRKFYTMISTFNIYLVYHPISYQP